MSDPKPRRPVKRRPGQPQLIELVGGPFDGQRQYIPEGRAFLRFAPAEVITCVECGWPVEVAVRTLCSQCNWPTDMQPEVSVYHLRTRSDGHPVMPLEVGETTKDGALLYDVWVKP